MPIQKPTDIEQNFALGLGPCVPGQCSGGRAAWRGLYSFPWFSPRHERAARRSTVVGRAFFVLQTGSIFSQKAGEHCGNRLSLRHANSQASEGNVFSFLLFSLHCTVLCHIPRLINSSFTCSSLFMQPEIPLIFQRIYHPSRTENTHFFKLHSKKLGPVWVGYWPKIEA